jgi:hypothetical protein
MGTDPDTKSEARGDSREAVGNTARDTDTDPTGPDGNDRTRNRPRRDAFDATLDRDSGGRKAQNGGPTDGIERGPSGEG